MHDSTGGDTSSVAIGNHVIMFCFDHRSEYEKVERQVDSTYLVIDLSTVRIDTYYNGLTWISSVFHFKLALLLKESEEKRSGYL